MSDREDVDPLGAILDALEAEDDYVRSWKLARQIRNALAAHDEAVRVSERVRLAGEIEARAHEIYPEDIFRKPTSEDYAEVNSLLQRERGHQLDGIAGDCYRHAHAGIARAVREGDLDPDGAERS